MDLLPYLGFSVGIAALAIYFYIRSLIDNAKQEVKSETVKDNLTNIIEKQDAQIKILSDRTPIDVEQLLRGGEF